MAPVLANVVGHPYWYLYDVCNAQITLAYHDGTSMIRVHREKSVQRIDSRYVIVLLGEEKKRLENLCFNRVRPRKKPLHAS